MNFDEFEQKVRNVAARPIPPAWREDILGPLSYRETVADAPWWKQWLWPHPIAWATMTTVWMAIFALQFAAAPESHTISASLPKSVSDMRHAFEERIRLMAELSEEPPRPRSSPAAADRPRSSRQTGRVTV